MSHPAKRAHSGEAAQLMAKAERILSARHYSCKTLKAYLHWIGRFLTAYQGADPYALREPDVNRFLSHMAVELNVASSTQNQALAAIKFFYKFAVGEPLESLNLIKARGARRMITALTAEEVSKVLAPRCKGSHSWSACSCTVRAFGLKKGSAFASRTSTSAAKR